LEAPTNGKKQIIITVGVNVSANNIRTGIHKHKIVAKINNSQQMSQTGFILVIKLQSVRNEQNRRLQSVWYLAVF